MANTRERPTPDCMSCWKYEECSRAEAGSFCLQWQSKKTQPRGDDPNSRWQRGEEDAL